MRWIVDVDLRARNRGVIQFADSLARSSGPQGAERFVPVHVLEQAHLRSELRLHHLDEVVDEARGAAREVVRGAADATAFGDVQVVQAIYEEDGLVATREEQGADALVVARQDHQIVRLGRVARRLLRSPPCGVVVVPPALPDDAQLDGPVVALTALRENSTEAFRFAARLASDAHRELVALHVASGDEHGEADLAAWAAGSGLRADRYVILRGDVVHEGLAFADTHHALLLAVGFRPRTGLERVLGRSVGRALAARARRPVAVVPSAISLREAAPQTSGARVPLHA